MSGDEVETSQPARMASNAARTTLGLLPLIALSAALTGPAGAQQATPVPGQVSQDTDGDIVLETVTVGAGGNKAKESYKADRLSSKKLTAPLLDTPRTVTVVTQKQIEERGQTSLVDVLRTTPGVTLGAGEGGTPLGDRPFIRGFEASTDMYIDGIRTLGRTTYESFNLEAVEIIKGPGSAYSGRGSTGGSINMLSKSARFGENFHELSGTIGTDDQYRSTYDGNYANENVAARLNLMWQDSDVPGRDNVFQDRWGIAGSFAARLGDKTKATLNIYHMEADEMPDYGIPGADANYVKAFGDTSRGTGTKDDPFLPLRVDRDNFYGLVERDFREAATTTVVGKVEHEFTDTFRVESVLAYFETQNNYIVTPPWLVGGIAVDSGNRNSLRSSETLTHQTNFTGEINTGAIEHSFAFGYEIGTEKLYSGSFSNIPTAPTTDIWNPDAWRPLSGGPAVKGKETLGNKTDTIGVYALDTIKLNEQWLLNLGVRFDDYKIEAGTQENHSQMFNYQAGVVYKPLPNASIYASFATASNPSGQTQGLGGGTSEHPLNAATANLDPERTNSYEIGTKWDLYDNRLALSAALFYTEKTNRRITDAFGDTVLGGNVEAKGIEIGIVGDITDRWNISAGYVYTDAKIAKGGYVNAGTSAAPKWVPDPDVGNVPVNIAKHSFALWTTYKATEKWIVGGGATYVGDRYTVPGNTSMLPATWRVDLMTSYKFNETALLQLNVNNVFDEALYETSHFGGLVGVGPGRNATLKLNVKF